MGSASVLVYVMWDDIKTLLAGQTADIASRSLSDHEIRENASVFAKAIVQQVLQDPEVFKAATVFLDHLVRNEQTTALLTHLVVDTLKSPGTLKQVQVLLIDLINDPITQRKLIDLLIVRAVFHFASRGSGCHIGCCRPPYNSL